jgi:hypothetical protein
VVVVVVVVVEVVEVKMIVVMMTHIAHLLTYVLAWSCVDVCMVVLSVRIGCFLRGVRFPSGVVSKFHG